MALVPCRFPRHSHGGEFPTLAIFLLSLPQAPDSLPPASRRPVASTPACPGAASSSEADRPPCPAEASSPQPTLSQQISRTPFPSRESGTHPGHVFRFLDSPSQYGVLLLLLFFLLSSHGTRQQSTTACDAVPNHPCTVESNERLHLAVLDPCGAELRLL